MLARMSSHDPASLSLPLSQFETRADYPMGRALRLLGDVPTLLIICTLLHRTHRFGELRTAVGGVSPKTISQRLRLLEVHGFVEREAFAEIPPRVEYHLTVKGRALADIMAAIQQFGERYLSDAPSSSGGCSQQAALPDDACDSATGL